MQSFATADEMFTSTIAELFRRGALVQTRRGMTREIIGWSACLQHPSSAWVSNERRALSPYYAAAEILWYMSGDPSVEMIKTYAPQYEGFANDGEVYGGYGRRLFDPEHHVDLLSQVVTALKHEPNERFVVAGIWRQKDIYAASKMLAVEGVEIPNEQKKNDVPCTLTWQFLIRNGRLHMVVTMRSQDVWLGLPYDVFWNCTIQRLIATELGLPLGEYYHQCGSIHLYEKNWVAANEAVQANFKVGTVWKDNTSVVADMRNAARLEQLIRLGEFDGVTGGEGSMAFTCAALCAKQLGKKQSLAKIDPTLLEATNLYDYSRGS
jgi:thymidylate synthase